MLRKLTSIAAILFCLTTTPPVAAQPPVLPHSLALTREVHAFIPPGGHANSGFILTGEGVIVIDSQMNEPLAQEMLRLIRQLTDQPVLYVINTHYHGDHTFSNHVFSPTDGIIAHKNTLLFLQEHGDSHLKDFERFFGPELTQGIRVTLPTQTLKAPLTLTFGDQVIEILSLGEGHTNADLVVYLPREKILFTGDLVYSHRLPWLSDGDTRSWLKTLKKIKALDIKMLVPGHGSVTDRRGIDRFERYLTHLRAAVFTALLKGATLEEMKRSIHLDEFQEDLHYAQWLPLHIEKVFSEVQGGE